MIFHLTHLKKNVNLREFLHMLFYYTGTARTPEILASADFA